MKRQQGVFRNSFMPFWKAALSAALIPACFCSAFGQRGTGSGAGTNIGIPGGANYGAPLLLVLLIGAALYFLLRKTQPPQQPVEYVHGVTYHLGTWVFLLADGSRYAGIFASIGGQIRLNSPERRRVAALNLAEAIKSKDVIDAAYLLEQGSPNAGHMADEAEATYQRHLDLVGGTRVSTQTRQADVCIVGLITTDVSLDEPPENPTAEQLLRSLKVSNAGNPGAGSAMFFYYLPAAKEDGRAIFEQIASVVRAGARAPEGARD